MKYRPSDKLKAACALENRSKNSREEMKWESAPRSQGNEFHLPSIRIISSASPSNVEQSKCQGKESHLPSIKIISSVLPNTIYQCKWHVCPGSYSRNPGRRLEQEGGAWREQGGMWHRVASYRIAGSRSRNNNPPKTPQTITKLIDIFSET